MKKRKRPARSAARHALEFRGLFALARKIVIFAIGVTVLLFGIVLIFLPGPAIVVIPIGLAILATEFIWARRLLKQVKDKAKEIAAKARLKK